MLDGTLVTLKARNDIDMFPSIPSTPVYIVALLQNYYLTDQNIGQQLTIIQVLMRKMTDEIDDVDD